MKYLSIIYYDTFARFFCAIEDAVKERDSAAEFLHLAIFPSGWLYMKVKGRNVRLLPLEVRKPYVAEREVGDADLDKIAHYHAVTGARFGSGYKHSLRKRARNYLGTMERILGEFRPDAVLFSGDTRIACEALQYHLDQVGYEGKRFYFEQGPNGTTIFDRRGVNANCSFRRAAANLTGEGYDPETAAKQLKFKKNPMFRGSDYVAIGILRLFGRLPPEWDTMPLRKLSEADYSNCIAHGRRNARSDSTEILVALQVPDDANNIHHNPMELRDIDLVTWVLRASSRLGSRVRVREHPLYRRRYSAEMYKLLSSNDRVALSDSDLSEDLADASVVVTVNSMTGLDAYIRKIPVILLGNAFYDHLPGVERAQTEACLEKSLTDLTKHGLASRLGGRSPSSIFAEMRAKYFIDGHYLDAELSAPQTIAKILTQQITDRAGK
ncbi:capsular polysaccharide export protein [Marinobacter sp. DSM 26671]|uniref:capsular polysaccharide export protein, LipB/KpsS family n=1 Tax=Marinobacter sp. DSM 26671 TaxID=1761793 RepID=UPI0008E60CFB|nr:hypothetical protein [Marinobacter sp. DSM 26671]SFE23847.1 capsular polysaccharide export protein [Marinobacter sp. DSM 26671]